MIAFEDSLELQGAKGSHSEADQARGGDRNLPVADLDMRWSFPLVPLWRRIFMGWNSCWNERFCFPEQICRVRDGPES